MTMKAFVFVVFALLLVHPFPQTANAEYSRNAQNTNSSLGVFASTRASKATCSSPGKSPKCKPKKLFKAFVRNRGRIDFQLFRIDAKGKLRKLFMVFPGQRRKLPPTCKGQRWLIKTACGRCAKVFVIKRPGTLKLLHRASERSCPNFKGRWDPPREWGIVPVAIANVPHPSGGKLLGFAAQSGRSYGGGSSMYRTEAQLFDPKSNKLTQINLNGHDIFCGALTLLPDGTMFAGGGGEKDNSYKVSTFDPFSLKWKRHADLKLGHWYGTAVVTEDNRVIVSLGEDRIHGGWKSYQNFPEISGPNFDFSKWHNMTGIDYAGKHADKKHWYPQQHLMSNGEILHYGTQNSIYTISTRGRGSIRYLTERNKVRTEDETWGATSVFFDEGKVLELGGVEGWNEDEAPNKSVFKRAIVITFKNPGKIQTAFTQDLHFRRAFANAVVLPDGQVLVIGGKDNTNQWDDTRSQYAPEMWNPVTEKWTLLAEHRHPRNYHSVAILTESGTVVSGGGGLCGGCAGRDLNKMNTEVFHPPYLFDRAGRRKPRPVIRSAPKSIKAQAVFKIRVSGAGAGKVGRVSLVKQSVITHSISTDQRQVALHKVGPRKDVGGGVYEYGVVAKMNRNVLVPGYWFLFVFNDAGTPSEAASVRSK